MPMAILEYPLNGSPKIRKSVFGGDYLPRECGLATFTSELPAAFATAHPQSQCFANSANDIQGGHDCLAAVRVEREEQDLSSEHRATGLFNVGSVDIVCPQREFGSSSGPAGGSILARMLELRIPVVTTLPTVLLEPGADQRRATRELIGVRIPDCPSPSGNPGGDGLPAARWVGSAGWPAEASNETRRNSDYYPKAS